MTPNLLRPSGQHPSDLENPAGRCCHLGPRQENPLSLLGQYSDDELDEEERKETKQAAILESKPSGCANEQVDDFLADLQTSGLFENNSDHKKAAVSEENMKIEHVGLDATNSVPTVMHEVKQETDINAASSTVIKDSSTSSLPALGITQTQKIKIIENEWKAVMHEQSGQYYYWNIRTGETTWEMPSILVQEATESAEERDPFKVESSQDVQLALGEGSLGNLGGKEAEPGVPGIQEEPSSTPVLPEVPKSMLSGDHDKESNEMQDLDSGFQLDVPLKGGDKEVQLTCCDEGKDGLNNVLGSVDESGLEVFAPHKSVLSQQMVDGDVENNSKKICEEVESVEREKLNADEQLQDLKQEFQEHAPNPLELLKWSENLSQRFKALEGISKQSGMKAVSTAGDTVRVSNLRLRYALEAEIRLADCKALYSCGDSLVPFWLHTQAQLKRLESVLGVEEAANSAGVEQSRLLHSRHISSTSFSSLRPQTSSKTVSQESGRDEKDNMPTSQKSDYPSPKHGECIPTKKADDLVPSSQDKEYLSSLQDEEDRPSPKHDMYDGSPNQVHTCHETSNDLEEGEIRPSSETLDDSRVPDVAAHVLSSPSRFERNDSKREGDPSAGERVVENSEDGVEDVDMEVDMDVDDQIGMEVPIHEDVGPLSHDGQALQASLSDLSLPSTVPVVPTGVEPLLSISIGDDVCGAPPPPPEEEWAPPPPPESDSIPPPPPDEPPPSPSPPSAPCNGYEEPLCPPLPYTEQYTSVYVSMPNYNYYPSTSSEVANPVYYVPADGGQTEGTQLPYYDQSASAYAEGSGLNNPVEGVIYYEAASNIIPVSLGMNSPECSTYYRQAACSTSIESSIIDTDAKQVDSTSGTTSLTCSVLGAKSTEEVASTQVANYVPNSSSASATVVASTGGGMTGTTTAGPKNVSKVVRSKKRPIAVAPTLRSNKKVSSLVDKWKAAKEELHGSDEDENEAAYESLEKKRQREIEEWRMQQIASGEAQDNANFQPLGGDWRERVKRRKAEATVEDKPQASPVAGNSASEGTSGKKKPDLVVLSKDLPNGWQAFWDESSGEVYYGNLTTSETTWDRPKGSG